MPSRKRRGPRATSSGSRTTIWLLWGNLCRNFGRCAEACLDAEWNEAAGTISHEGREVMLRGIGVNYEYFNGGSGDCLV